MTLASDLSDGLDAVYDYAGVACTYTDRNGAITEVTAIIDYALSQYGDVADVAGKTAVISVRVSDLADRPRRAETYTIAGTVYSVDSIIRADDLEHVALVA